MDKSPEAFRTISEVAEALETPAHVLRFWESRFPQIRPVKRAGGRRYSRPSDVALLTGIKRLLHDDGMTIRGVQKILREQGVRHVAGLSDEISAEEEALGLAMAGRLDDEPAGSPDEAAEATAAALRAALDPPPLPPGGAAILPFPGEAGRGQQPALPGFEPPEDPVLMDPLDEAGVGPEAEAGPAADSPDMAPAEPAAPPPEAEAVADAAPAAPPPPPLAPDALAPDALADLPGATLAARLRALPRGSLSLRAAALHGLRGRMADLRARLALPPGGL